MPQIRAQVAFSTQKRWDLKLTFELEMWNVEGLRFKISLKFWGG
jgi:hypothetical protein